MPTSPSKRLSAGGRLGRLLASLRAPARARPPFPVQTGFPTSLADLVVKNHGRLKHPTRRRHRPSAVPPPPAAERTPESPPLPVRQQDRRQTVLTTVRDAAVRRPKGAAFSVRPAEVLAVGGAVVLALLVVWSKWPVVAATVASVSLLWIESVRSSASLRRPRPEPEVQVLGGRGRVSPIRGAESEAGTPSWSADSDDRGSEVSSLWSADSADLDGGGGDDPVAPKRKEKKRSLRKLFGRKPRNNGKRSKDKDTDTGGESEHQDAGEAGMVTAPVKTVEPPAVDTMLPVPDAIVDESCCRQSVAFPSSALVPIILVGLVAGKLPAVALIVLCAVFSTSVDRVPVTTSY